MAINIESNGCHPQMSNNKIKQWRITWRDYTTINSVVSLEIIGEVSSHSDDVAWDDTFGTYLCYRQNVA